MIDRLPLPAALDALVRRVFFPEGSFRVPLPSQLDRVIIFSGLVAGAVITPILLVLIVLLVFDILSAPELVFWLVSALIVGSALGAVLLKNIVHAAISLVVTLLGVAGIFLLLGSEFLALVQILVYGGGVTILLLFGLMLTNATDDPIVSDGAQKPFAFLVGIALAGILSVALVDQVWRAPVAPTIPFPPPRSPRRPRGGAEPLRVPRRHRSGGHPLRRARRPGLGRPGSVDDPVPRARRAAVP